VAGLYVDGVADGRFRRLGRDLGVQRSVRATRAVSTFLCMISRVGAFLMMNQSGFLQLA